PSASTKLLGIASAIRYIPQKSIAVFDSNASLHPEAKIIVVIPAQRLPPTPSPAWLWERETVANDISSFA
ncbi:MAG TPA: hypothetical protein VGH29_00005, partial [Candidatus Binataceae bacterium]